MFSLCSEKSFSNFLVPSIESESTNIALQFYLEDSKKDVKKSKFFGKLSIQFLDIPQKKIV